MAKHYSVIHIDKGTTTSGSLGRHIDRTNTPKNADPARAERNFCIVKDGKHISLKPLMSTRQKPLTTRVNDRIKEGYNGKTALRKDAVKQLNVILTGTHEGFEKMDGTSLREWIFENYRFLATEYGADNIVGFVGHLDERTPHIHATIVPLTPDGRLSAKEIVGNNKKLAELQDKYSKAMLRYGFERGERGSKVAHKTTQEYYKAIRSTEVENVAKNVSIELESPPTGFFADTESYLERQKSKISKAMGVLSDSVTTVSNNAFRLLRENTLLRVRNEALERERKELKNKLEQGNRPDLGKFRRENLGRGFGR